VSWGRRVAAEGGARLEVVVEKILQPLIDGAEMAGEGAVLFATEREEVIHQRSEAVGAGRRGHAGLADLAQLQVEIGHELGVVLGGARLTEGRLGGGEQHGGRRRRPRDAETAPTECGPPALGNGGNGRSRGALDEIVFLRTVLRCISPDSIT
jgi:hypothetical protein